MGLTYGEWQQGLFDLLVASGDPGRPLYLFVDRDDLAQVGGSADSQLALDDFCHAYLSHVGRTEPFRYEFLRAQGFSPSSPDAPPFLLGLVMSVLAVTEAPVGGIHGVYPRQNALLGRPARAQAPPRYAEHVPAMWQAWNRWLEDGGARYGRPTARSHPHWTHQGWARSQGIFRHQDRSLIQDFFEDRGIEPGDHIEPMRLVSGLESWLLFHRRDGGRLLTLLRQDDAVRDVLADLLESELAGWTGQVARSLAERRPRGLLVYDDWGGAFSLALTVTPDLEGTTIDVGGQRVTLDAASGLVAIPSRTAPADLLENGESLRLSDSLVLRGGGDSAYVFDESIDAQGLLQERRPLLGRAYTLLVHADVLPRARLALEAAGASGFRVVTGRHRAGRGWRTSCSPGSSRPHSRTCWLVPHRRLPRRRACLAGCESARPRTSPVGRLTCSCLRAATRTRCGSTASRTSTTRQMTTWSTCPRTFQPADMRFSSRTTGWPSTSNRRCTPALRRPASATPWTTPPDAPWSSARPPARSHPGRTA